MTRRTALQIVATVFAALAGKPVTQPLQSTEPGVQPQAPNPKESLRSWGLKMGRPTATAMRLHLTDEVALEIEYRGKRVIIDKDELMAALSEPPVF